MEERGGISVQTEHIFPIIKRWLYSDKDIFLREIVSNASDAITKLRHLCAIGEAQGIDESCYRITVTLDEKAKTVSVDDNGIGMTADEVRNYINNIALSGALDFVKKYEGSRTGRPRKYPQSPSYNYFLTFKLWLGYRHHSVKWSLGRKSLLLICERFI